MPFLSLVATTKITVHHFPLSVGAPLYLQFCFKSYYKLWELSKSSGEQERSHVSRCLPFLKLLSLQCQTAETSPEPFEEFQVLTHLPPTELLLKTEPSPARLDGSWEPKSENLLSSCLQLKLGQSLYHWSDNIVTHKNVFNDNLVFHLGV